MDTVVTHVETDGIATPSYSQYPTELGESWVQVTFFEDHPTLGGVIALYKNNRYTTGTIIFSKYILNDYPDMYLTFTKNGNIAGTDKNTGILADRMYTNPIYRKRGYWKFVGTLMRSIIYSYNKRILDGTTNRAMAIERAYLKMMSLGGQKRGFNNNGRMFKHSGSEIEPPREPSFPFIWYNQRIGGITNGN